jgi:hypothetical protein
MIKCPKCQFEQPDDIYCAQCGVNMKNFVAPKVSLFKLFLANQVLQIGILFVAIIAFVIYDYSKDQKRPTTQVGQAARQQSRPIDIREPTPPPLPPPSSVKSATPPPTPAAVSASRSQGKKMNMAQLEKTKADVAEVAAPLSSVPKSSLQVNFYQISRNTISEIQRDSTSSQLSGDGIGGIISKKRLAAIKKNGELKAVSANKYKLDGMPITLFKGLRSSESAKSVGIYLQINTLRNDPTALQMEVKSWGHVKLQEPDESLFSSEMTIDSQHVSFVTGFLPKDKTFNDEEKSLFESDRALKIYNQEDFWDGNTDLIMFLELPD